jgi:tRNA (mo5U34)-methyltransferase
MTGLPTSPDDPRLDGWYHTIDLGQGLVSRGVFDHRSVVDRFGLPESMAGMTALDIGTGDGFFAFEMERRGADEVTAIDVARLGDCDWLPRMRSRIGDSTDITTWPDHFRMAHAMRRSRVEYRYCSIYDLSPYTVGTFDVVFCGSLLLHLQNPMLALQNIRSVTREMAVIETAVDVDGEASLPGQPTIAFGAPGPEGEPGETNVFWLLSTTALQKMLRYADFAVTEPQAVFELPPVGPMATSVVAYPHARPAR